jgi:hypothetical protein
VNHFHPSWSILVQVLGRNHPKSTTPSIGINRVKWAGCAVRIILSHFESFWIIMDNWDQLDNLECIIHFSRLNHFNSNGPTWFDWHHWFMWAAWFVEIHLGPPNLSQSKTIQLIQVAHVDHLDQYGCFPSGIVHWPSSWTNMIQPILVVDANHSARNGCVPSNWIE